ncbi:NADP-dependent 3-hydroxy acid dehydrogenase YdfG [Deinococcus metalli]|uniref:NADP-dependent 3-hydroxy acid dehydrogenase YdfG n=1 Tax=Deinococcus metalli TaxID=1141878 RepID=A0A7W8KDU9_9DEIO|nr:SDR family NAD(P)-dependent oxidoreductase [Deinococcus metalli]MBB5376375.1 NADP-dependent 3-hydroxy acid dehydrogenase YdfG [Deinococcus metalli]GHF44508.1 short-chain dehydrogenase [Deinococcus metalli]
MIRRLRPLTPVLALSLLGTTLLAGRRSRPPQARPLLGRTVVITGASSGIGRATALECAARGAQVVVAARDAAALDAVVREGERLGGVLLAVPTDVTVRAQVEALVAAAVARFGRIDVMVNHAGDMFVDRVEHSEEARVRALIDVNVMGVLYGIQAAVPVMRRQGGGHVINMASVEGRVGFPYSGIYGGTKAFVEVMTQTLRQELMHVERTGISVTAVLPAAVRTPLWDRAVNVEAGGQGAHLVWPVVEASHVAHAIADAIVHPRPLVYPLRVARGAAVLYDVFPGLAGRLLSRLRVDRHVNLLSAAQRGSGQATRPISPVVRGGRLHDV